MNVSGLLRVMLQDVRRATVEYCVELVRMGTVLGVTNASVT